MKPNLSTKTSTRRACATPATTRADSPDRAAERHRSERTQAGRRILLVDDDPTVRGSIQDVLVVEGYLVTVAENGLKALDLAARSPVDLVLLDLNMPVKNGWDTFERLTAEHPLIPIIIVTARPNQLFMALNAGVGALLEKPMDIPILLRTIEKLIGESAEQRLARLAGRKAEFHYSASRT